MKVALFCIAAALFSTAPANPPSIDASDARPYEIVWANRTHDDHDPILPMNMASDEAGGCEKIKKIMMEFLSRYDKLEL